MLRRYRATYGVGEEVRAEDAIRHFDLERELTRRLVASSRTDRWETFQECYDALYGSLPWLAGHGGEARDPERWAALLGPPPQHIYEVGSGSGGLAKALAERGYNVEATDVSVYRGDRDPVERLRWSLTDGVHLDRFATAAPYDAVISDQVVEHLHPDDLVDHLAGCYAVLRPGGRYIFRTPHAFTGPHDVSGVFGLDHPVGMHLREYTVAELSAALAAAGFSTPRAVFNAPRSFGRLSNKVVVSGLYFRYLKAVETLGRRAGRLPGPFKPRIFLVAQR